MRPRPAFRLRRAPDRRVNGGFVGHVQLQNVEPAGFSAREGPQGFRPGRVASLGFAHGGEYGMSGGRQAAGDEGTEAYGGSGDEDVLPVSHIVSYVG